MLRFTAGLVLALGFAAPALAEEVSFRSPTGNIHCAIWTGEWAGARCDLRELTQSYRKRPGDCDLDWGAAFGVGASGKGEVLCHGDTVTNPNAPALGYGKSVKLGAFTCTSEKTGMTCTNGLGHGFQVAKGKQKVF